MVNFDRLPQGITGISDRASPRRSLDPKLFKAACHRVAIHLGGAVSDFETELFARSYYACAFKTRRDHVSILGNAIYPLVGFVGVGQYGFRELAFLPCAEISAAFADLTDFKPLHHCFLTAAVTAQHLSELAPVELDQLKYWRCRGAAQRVGDIIFNAWD